MSRYQFHLRSIFIVTAVCAVAFSLANLFDAPPVSRAVFGGFLLVIVGYLFVVYRFHDL